MALSAQGHGYPVVSSIGFFRKGDNSAIISSKAIYGSQPSFSAPNLGCRFFDGRFLPTLPPSSVASIFVFVFFDGDNDNVLPTNDKTIAELFVIFAFRIWMGP